MPYQYVNSLNRYRDSKSGRFVPDDTVRGYVDRIAQSGQASSDVYAQLVSEGTISPREFGKRMRTDVKTAHLQQYILGRGGRDNMEPSDWGRVGRVLRDEYGLLDGFVADIESGALSQAQIAARASLYFDSARQSFENGNGAAYGFDPRLLPSVPGDDHQTCHGGCRCHWRYEKVFDLKGKLIAVNAFWEVDFTAEHCAPTATTRGCIQNAQDYNPFVIKVA
jgi:hypothetical protein